MSNTVTKARLVPLVGATSVTRLLLTLPLLQAGGTGSVPYLTLLGGESDSQRDVKFSNSMPEVPEPRTASLALEGELNSVFEMSRRANWDGDGAEGVTRETYRAAKEFCAALPASLAVPDVSADTNGWVTFTWHPRDGAILLASVREGEKVAFAMLLDGVSFKGDVPLGPMIQQKLVPQIDDLYPST